MIKDTAEINLDQPHARRLKAHKPVQGRSAVTIGDSVMASLRHRPDHLGVGEVRWRSRGDGSGRVGRGERGRSGAGWLAREVLPEEPAALTWEDAPKHPLRSEQGGPAEALEDILVRNETSAFEMREELPVRAKADGLPDEKVPLRAVLAAAEGAERLDLSGGT